MPRIKVDSDGISTIRQIIQRQTRTLQNIEKTISQISVNLDMQVATSEGIRQSLNSLRNASTQQQELLDGMSRVLTKVTDDFLRTDRNISNEAKEIQYLLDHAGTVATAGAATSIILSEYTWKQLNELFGITETGYSTTAGALGIINDETAIKAKQQADGASQIKAAQEMRVQNAIRKAISTDDSVAVYLANRRSDNEKGSMQVSSYAYNILTSRVTDTAKKIISGSEEVDEVRRRSIQAAYASMLNMPSPQYSENEFFEFLKNSVIKNADENIGLATTMTNDIIGEATGLGFSVAGGLLDMGIDIHNCAQWNEAQRTLLYEAVNSMDSELALLNELKTVYTDDPVLVDYCNSMMSDIYAYQKSEDFYNLVKGIEDAETAVKAFDKAISTALVDNYVPQGVAKACESFAKKLVEKGGNSVAADIFSNASTVMAAGKYTGYIMDGIAGTGDTIKALENADILYTNIEASIEQYNQISNSNSVSASAKRFQELYILNQKMACLEITTEINKTLNNKDAHLVEGVDSMVNSLQNAYNTLAP